MTQTAARHMAPEDLGDPEPVGLASTWSGEPPARRAFTAADEGPVMFQATPVRVDEAFPEYEAYRPAPELPTFDAVAPVPSTEQPSGWGETPVVALPPVPRAEVYGSVTGQLDPQHQPPVTPGLAPYETAPAPQVPAPIDIYAIDAIDATDVGLIAVGGTFMVLKKLAAIAPFVGVSVFFTIVASSFGMGAWIMAAFSWLMTAIAVVARPVGRTTMRRTVGRK